MTFHQACWLISVNRNRIVGSFVAGMRVKELVVVPLGKRSAAFNLSPVILGVSRDALNNRRGPMEVVILLEGKHGRTYVFPSELANETL